VGLRLALDSNRYTDLCRGDADVVRAVEEATEVFVPFVVIGELRAGFGLGSRTLENERVLARFLSLPDVKVMHTDDATTHHYATVFRQLRRQGTPIPSNDMWIAALVLQHDLVLYARDRHFDHLPQLKRLEEP
jgi:tRNA(fMet)-specific endonuclease VapC